MKIRKPYDFISKKISEIDSLTPKSNLLTIKDTVDHWMNSIDEIIRTYIIDLA